MNKVLKKKAAAGCCWIKLSLLLALFVSSATAQEYSALWGTNGNLWATNSLLRDFTDVGYMSGDEAIPDWPVGVVVTNFGAMPDDGIDDSQAFIDAIAACPSNHAVFVPNGRYQITDQIRVDRDYVVVRGEDMYQTVLFFPKNMGERYPQADYGEALAKGAFFQVDDGTHRSIENLTMEFREQTKMGHWEWRGAYAMRYEGDVVDSWIRNIYFKNVDEGIQFGGAERISVINVIFDQYIGRYDFIGTSGNARWEGHAAIRMTCKRTLMHNIEIKGKYFHPFDIINVPSYCVASSVQGTDMMFNNHGQGANHNLYTEVHAGNGKAIGLSQYQNFETFWNIDADIPVDPAQFTNSLENGHVMVGLNADYPTTISSNFYFEAIDPSALTPDNLYLAQLAYRGKPLPEGPPPPPPLPPELTGDVRILNPTDDNDVGGNPLSGSISFSAYLKFDLSDLQDLSSIAHARLRVCTKARKAGTAFNLNVASVADDSWTQETLTNSPAVGSVLDSVAVNDTTIHKWFEFDVTPFVQTEWSGDKTVSFKLIVTDKTGGDFIGGLHSREDGNAPQLLIERVADPVPGPPAAPTGVETVSSNGYIVLNWDDALESDFATYNVYRTPDKNASHPIAQGLVISDFADISDQENRAICEMSSNTVFRYTVTAVDKHGYESPHTEFFGTTLNATNDPPAFGAGPITVPDAMIKTAYSGSLADNASDPESDQLYFFKVSGPAWLNVASDGTLSGTPQASDAGTSQVTVQVNAIGGRDQALFSLTVDTPPDDPPGAPATPTGLSAAIDNNSVSLSWNANAEGDLEGYNIYRSTTSGSYGSALAADILTNAYVDSAVTNGTTYYYVVTAMDSNENESEASGEIFATPADMPPAAPTGLAAEAGNGSVRLDWADNAEDDLAGYVVYRSTNSGSYAGALAADVADSDYVDLTASNGITYYYVVAAVDTNGSESTQSTEISATPDEGLISYTTFIGNGVSGAADNFISNTTNWDNGLPVGRQGTVSINAAYDSNVSHDSYTVLHTAGTVSRGNGFAGFSIKAGSVWIMDGTNAVITQTRGLSLTDSQFTLNKGTANLTDNSRDTTLSGTSVMTINGGSLSVGRNLILSGGDLTVNGGTLDIANSFFNANFHGTGSVVAFNGGTTAVGGDINLTRSKSIRFDFGGTATGSVTIDGSLSGLASMDWLTGTKMALTISGSDEWAASEWDADQLSYNGQNKTALGKTWAEVTSADGLEAGVRFDYDSATETLSLVSEVISYSYDLWAAKWNTNIGTASNDFDADGINNLCEYGLDGNPTNALNRGTLPTFTKPGSSLIYVHPKRSDDSTLIYTVETTTNLTSGTWTNEGYAVVGTNVTGGTLNFVTNEVDTAENEKFIRLKIEQ